MSKIKMYLGLLSVVIISGCSHSIQMSPDLSAIRTNNTTLSDKSVGYYISPTYMNTEVTSEGGGGDKVKYFPYKDTEAALKTILSQKFNKVYTLQSTTDDPIIKNKNITYIFTPKIKTSSSSSSAFTWPPTDFTVELTCTAYTKDMKKIWEKTVTGKGNAEFSEFKSDFSLSARRASQDAFILIRDEMLSSQKLN